MSGVWRQVGRRGSLAAAVVGSLLMASAATAHTPIATDPQFPAQTVLEWKYGTGVPTWLQTPVNDAIDYQASNNSLWNSFQYNNSKAPNFTKVSGGSGTVIWSSMNSSPCNTGSTTWLMCAKDRGTSAWKIYIRNLQASPVNSGDGAGPYQWDDQGVYGAAGYALADVRRNVLHEALHHVLGPAHNSQSAAVTVMTSVTPHDGEVGWESTRVMVCDHAQMQMTFGIERNDGSIADCFDHIANAGTNGLETVLTLTTAQTTVCLNTPVTLSGLLRIANWGSYGEVGAEPIGARQVVIQRNGSSYATLTSGSTSGTFSTSANSSSAATHNFVADFSQVGSGDISPDQSPTLTLRWSSAC